jgi:hypothetical protein
MARLYVTSSGPGVTWTDPAQRIAPLRAGVLVDEAVERAVGVDDAAERVPAADLQDVTHGQAASSRRSSAITSKSGP